MTTRSRSSVKYFLFVVWTQASLDLACSQPPPASMQTGACLHSHQEQSRCSHSLSYWAPSVDYTSSCWTFLSKNPPFMWQTNLFIMDGHKNVFLTPLETMSWNCLASASLSQGRMSQIKFEFLLDCSIGWYLDAAVLAPVFRGKSARQGSLSCDQFAIRMRS